jgi:translation initiation factor IF-2
MSSDNIKVKTATVKKKKIVDIKNVDSLEVFTVIPIETPVKIPVEKKVIKKTIKKIVKEKNINVEEKIETKKKSVTKTKVVKIEKAQEEILINKNNIKHEENNRVESPKKRVIKKKALNEEVSKEVSNPIISTGFIEENTILKTIVTETIIQPEVLLKEEVAEVVIDRSHLSLNININNTKSIVSVKKEILKKNSDFIKKDNKKNNIIDNKNTFNVDLKEIQENNDFNKDINIVIEKNIQKDPIITVEKKTIIEKEVNNINKKESEKELVKEARKEVINIEKLNKKEIIKKDSISNTHIEVKKNENEMFTIRNVRDLRIEDPIILKIDNNKKPIFKQDLKKNILWNNKEILSLKRKGFGEESISGNIKKPFIKQNGFSNFPVNKSETGIIKDFRFLNPQILRVDNTEIKKYIPTQFSRFVKVNDNIPHTSFEKKTNFGECAVQDELTIKKNVEKKCIDDAAKMKMQESFKPAYYNKIETIYAKRPMFGYNNNFKTIVNNPFSVNKDRFKKKAVISVIKPQEISIYDGITPHEISIASAIDTDKIEKVIKNLGLNSLLLSRDDAEFIVLSLGLIPKKILNFQEEIEKYTSDSEDKKNIRRNICITVAGHVNHGKTSLVEALIGKKNLCIREKGNITQSVLAHKVDFDGNGMILIDTPGHDIFLSARETAIKLSDMLILVVDVTEGVKKQTKEIVHVAKEYNKKIIVAFNKIDSYTKINRHTISNQLNDIGLQLEEIGGDVMSVEISALKGTNIKELVDIINIQGDLIDLYSNFDREAVGYFLNTSLEKGMGIVGQVILKNGSLNCGDTIFLKNGEFFDLRLLQNTDKKNIKKGNPNDILTISPLSHFISPGEFFFVVNNKEVLSHFLKKHEIIKQQELLSEETVEKNIIIKGDTMIDILSLKDAFDVWKKDEKIDIKPNIISSSVNILNEKDIELAKDFNADIIMFNTKIPNVMQKLIGQMNIRVIVDDIIYHIFDKIKDIFRNEIKKVLIEKVVGTAEVLKIFIIDDKMIIGCIVRKGEVFRGKKAIVKNKKGEVLFIGTILTLKRGKDDIKSSKEGYDCGLRISGISPKDLIVEGYIVECIDEVESEELKGN